MAFERFPDEVLIGIVHYVGLDGRVSSWRNLTSVNRTLHCIVTPLLYEQFTEANYSSAPKLLRTVLANPNLATGIRRYKGSGIPNAHPQDHVRSLSLLYAAPTFIRNLHQSVLEKGGLVEGEFLDVSALQEVDFFNFQETMKRIGCQDRKDWVSDIRKGKWHAVTSMLLLLLTNLEELELLEYRHDIEAGYLEYALGIAARLQSYTFTSHFSLKHLTRVSLSACPPPQRMDPFKPLPDPEYLYLADVIPFFKLPSIKSMSISRLVAVEGNDYVPPDFPSKDLKFTTRELELTESCLEMWRFAQLLRTFTCLRRLVYNHVAERVDFLPQEIGRAILHLTPCLEELVVSYAVEENGYNNSPEKIGSLAMFEKLRKIEIEGPILLGYPSSWDGSMPDIQLCNILPRPLETLVMSPSDSQVHEEHLRGLILAEEKKFSDLKRVEMRRLGKSIKDPEGLKMEYKAKGVELVL
jgi:hypothetical protein